MQPLYNVLVKLTVVTIFFIVFYYYVPLKQFRMLDFKSKVIQESNLVAESIPNKSFEPPIYIWCIMLKIENYDSLLLRKLESFSNSLLQHTKHRISLNILTDAKSRSFVQDILNRKTIRNQFYEVRFCTPFQKWYYNDLLAYINVIIIVHKGVISRRCQCFGQDHIHNKRNARTLQFSTRHLL